MIVRISGGSEERTRGVQRRPGFRFISDIVSARRWRACDINDRGGQRIQGRERGGASMFMSDHEKARNGSGLPVSPG